MIQTQEYGETSMWLVSAINITNVHPKQTRVGMTLRPLNPAERVCDKVISPEGEHNRWNGYKVLSPVTASQIATQIPTDWETSPVDVDTLDNAPFANGENRDSYFWRQIDAQEKKEAEEAGE